MSAVTGCPQHRRKFVRRAVVHAKGCPGARGAMCMDTCHPTHWSYCLQCDWRARYSVINNVDPDSDALAESARVGLLIRRFREKAKISQVSASIHVGISKSYMGLLETGCLQGSDVVVRRAVDYLNDAAPPHCGRLVLSKKKPDSRLQAIAAAVPRRLGALCRRARLELMLVDDLVAAREMGVDPAKLKQFEQGEGGLDSSEIARVMDYLGVELPQVAEVSA